MILWIYDAHSEHCPLTKLTVIDRIFLVCRQESNPLSDRSSACSDKFISFLVFEYTGSVLLSILNDEACNKTGLPTVADLLANP